MSDGKLGAQPHYAQAKIEPIQAIEAWGLDFHLGSALKYIVRAGHKAGETRAKDLTKALWYLRRRVEWDAPTAWSQPGSGDVALFDALAAWNLVPALGHAVKCMHTAAHVGSRRDVDIAAEFVAAVLEEEK